MCLIFIYCILLWKMADRIIRTLSSRNDSEIAKQDYDLLKRDYLSLQVSYDHLKKRLEFVERNKIDNEKRHQDQLLQFTSEFKQMIQILESDQNKRQLDLEGTKEKLKLELSSYYDIRNAELSSQLEELGQTYNSLRLQYTVLKTEFQSLQRSREENEEIVRIQNEIRLEEFRNEKQLLLNRIHRLTSETTGNVLSDSEKEKYVNLQRQFERSENELKNYRHLYEQSSNVLKSERLDHQNSLNELNKEIRSYKASLLSLQQEFDSLKSENVEFQKKIDMFEKREIEFEQTSNSLRRNNDVLKTHLHDAVEGIENRLNLEIIDLKKQRDIKCLENEDLCGKVKSLENDLLTKRRQLDEMEIHLDEVKQNSKTLDLEQKETFLMEKRNLEKKIQEVESERNRLSLKFEKNYNTLQLKFQQCQFEKERIGEELANLKMQNTQVKLDEKTSLILAEENERKKEIHKNIVDHTSLAIKSLSSDLELLKNELRQKDDSLTHMVSKFESQQEKNVQFYEILKLCDSRLNAPPSQHEKLPADEFAYSLSLMNDIRSELKKLRSGRKSKKNAPDGKKNE